MAQRFRPDTLAASTRRATTIPVAVRPRRPHLSSHESNGKRCPGAGTRGVAGALATGSQQVKDRVNKEQVLGNYKNLVAVEDAFCQLKSYLEVCPVFRGPTTAAPIAGIRVGTLKIAGQTPSAC
jgi:hypothetical protein